jgi:hypothetical protein
VSDIKGLTLRLEQLAQTLATLSMPRVKTTKLLRRDVFVTAAQWKFAQRLNQRVASQLMDALGLALPTAPNPAGGAAQIMAGSILATSKRIIKKAKYNSAMKFCQSSRADRVIFIGCSLYAHDSQFYVPPYCASPQSCQNHRRLWVIVY